MRILITGAAGIIGRLVTDDLAAEHDVVATDIGRMPWDGAWRRDLRRYLDDRPRVRRLLPWRSWWATAFAGMDAVIHLALRRTGGLGVLFRDNLAMTMNVLDAATRYGVPRVVFASTNWVVRGRPEFRAPRWYDTARPTIGSDAPARPGSSHGVQKAAGEYAGEFLVREGKLRSFLAVRIGSVRPAGAPPAVPDAGTSLWMGHRDTRSLFRRAVEAPYEGYHVAYGVSAQPHAPFDLTETRRVLGWTPEEQP